MSVLKKFESIIRTFRHFLNVRVGYIAAISGISVLSSVICLLLLVSPLFMNSTTWCYLMAASGLVTSAYVGVIIFTIVCGQRNHTPGQRKFPYVFTLAKSALQISVLMVFTCLDSHLKKNNAVYLVVAIVSFHIHVVVTMFAFHLGEDYDVATSFLAASYSLIYELANGSWQYFIYFNLAAIILLWIKNVLFLVPPPVIEELSQAKFVQELPLSLPKTRSVPNTMLPK